MLPLMLPPPRIPGLRPTVAEKHERAGAGFGEAHANTVHLHFPQVRGCHQRRLKEGAGVP